MLSSNKIVAIVVVNFNGYKDTINCINSLLNLKNVNFLICIVDNSSTNNSLLHLNEWLSVNKYNILINTHIIDLKILKTDYNGGFAYANNFAIRFLMNISIDYYWFLNNDTEVDQYSLFFLLSKMNNEPNLGICGSTLIYYGTNTIQALGGGFFSKYSASTSLFYSGRNLNDIISGEVYDVQLDFIAGASMLVSNKFIQDIGLMNESYFLYFEELDWSVRALNRYQIGFDVNSIVFHKVGASIGTDKLSKLSQFYIIRALTLFYIFYYPFLLPILFFKIFRVILYLLKNKKYSLIPITISSFRHGLLLRRGISSRHSFLIS